MALKFVTSSGVENSKIKALEDFSTSLELTRAYAFAN